MASKMWYRIPFDQSGLSMFCFHVESAWIHALETKVDILLSSFAFKFNLRRYTQPSADSSSTPKPPTESAHSHHGRQLQRCHRHVPGREPPVNPRCIRVVSVVYLGYVLCVLGYIEVHKGCLWDVWGCTRVVSGVCHGSITVVSGVHWGCVWGI